MAFDTNSNPFYNIVRVKLIKQKKYGLGFLIRKRPNTSDVIVSDLIGGGMAAESGLVQIGDIILKVNDTSLEDKSYEESVSLLKALPVNQPVSIILKGPDGYMSHLETRFSYDGTPRTVRITRPCIPEESFIDRLKKSLSLTVTSSPNKSYHTKQTQVNNDSHDVNNIQISTNKVTKTSSGTNYNNNIRTVTPIFVTARYPDDTTDHETGGRRQGKEKGEYDHIREESLQKSVGITNGNNSDSGDDNTSAQSQNNPEDEAADSRCNSVTYCQSPCSTGSRPGSNRTSNTQSPVTVFINDKLETNCIENEPTRDEAFLPSELIKNQLGKTSPDSACGSMVQQSVNGLKESPANSDKGNLGTVYVNGDLNSSNSQEQRNIQSENGTVSKTPSNKGEGNKKGRENDHLYSGKRSPSYMDPAFGRRGSSLVGGNDLAGQDGRRSSMLSDPGSERRSSMLKKYVKLRNVGDERPVTTDTLHQKSMEVRLYFFEACLCNKNC